MDELIRDLNKHCANAGETVWLMEDFNVINGLIIPKTGCGCFPDDENNYVCNLCTHLINNYNSCQYSPALETYKIKMKLVAFEEKLDQQLNLIHERMDCLEGKVKLMENKIAHK